MSRLTDSLTLPGRTQALQVLAVAAVVAVICWYFGVNVLHALLLGVAITVIAFVCLVVTLTPQARDIAWRARKQAGGKGSRTDVANLSGALKGGWGQVGRTAERRLWQLARRRLALEGLDLQSAEHRTAIEARIGRTAYRTLKRTGKGGVRLRTLVHCLDTLDALNPTYYPAPQADPRQSRVSMIPRRRARER